MAICEIILFGDYSQGFWLPHHGNKQTGETYYYSPLGVNTFGMTSYVTEILNAHVYHEGEGKPILEIQHDMTTNTYFCYTH